MKKQKPITKKTKNGYKNMHEIVVEIFLKTKKKRKTNIAFSNLYKNVS